MACGTVLAEIEIRHALPTKIRRNETISLPDDTREFGKRETEPLEIHSENSNNPTEAAGRNYLCPSLTWYDESIQPGYFTPQNLCGELFDL